MIERFAKIISYLFHPLTMLTYMAALFLLINPFLFGKSDISQGGWLILQVFLSTFLVPGLLVVMMKNLGLISSIEMQERHDRIIPYIATGIFYLWIFMMVRKTTMYPLLFSIATLGTTTGLFLCFFFNNFFKISAHAAGVGGLLGIFLIAMRWFSYSYFYVQGITIPVYVVLMAVIILCGLVCTSRLLLKAHSGTEIIQGFGVGLLGMAVASWFMM